MKEVDVKAVCRLKAHKHRLTRQQYQTLKGQILAGQPNAAMRGLDKILQRKQQSNRGGESE